MSASDIRLVVFDIAGTTVDDGDAVNRCLREALAAHGISATRDAVNAVMGLSKPEAIARLAAEVATANIAAIHREFLERMRRFYQTAGPDDLREYPGTSETFRRLRAAGIAVALDTGFDRSIADTVIARMSWPRDGLLSATVTSDEVPRGRPHPDMIRHLMRQLGVSDPTQVAKVGDTPADIEEGLNADCGLVVGVTSGTHTHEQLSRFLGPPSVLLTSSVAEVPALLKIV